MTPTRSLRAAHVRAGLIALFLVAGIACESSKGTGPGQIDANVASVVVTGAPSTVLLVGDSVRLVATPVNETGGVVSNQNVSWRSSAPAVAAVRANGTVIALSSGRATITATAGGRDGSASLDIADGVTIGTQGGVLHAAGGAFNLTLPAGSVSQATLLLVHQAASPPADVRLVANTAFELGPDGVQFQRAGTLTMTYDAARIPSSLYGESLQLYSQSGNGWAVVPGSKVDVAAKTVTGSIYRAGVYVVRSTAVDRITLTGAAVNGALFTGQNAQLAAALYASTGDSLPARPMTWSSSDQGKVTVDATGKVVGVAPGTATITVTTDGKSAATTVTVLLRPTANWSQATDWTTYQGDARHSGYINATLDPTVFRERWTSTPFSGATYYQPTVGGGRVYLSTNAYFNAQKVIALDALDGTQKWHRDFGNIFGINQTTYDGGSVYVTSGGHQDTYLWALNEADGTLRFQTPFGSQWEHWKAPVVVGSSIVTAGGYYGGMYGFNRSTGAQTFFLAGPQVDGWGPAAKDGLVYATGGYVLNGGVRAVDPTNGSVVSDISDSRLTAVTSPVIGNANNVLTIINNRLISVDLVAKRVAWEQSGSYSGMPVVGEGVVYGASGTVIAARRESDGALLWSWTPPAPYTTMQNLLLTSNVLFVGVSAGYGGAAATFAIDLPSHLAVWSYPTSGELAMSSAGVLYIVQGAKIVAISVR